MPGTHSTQSLLNMSRGSGITAFSPESHPKGPGCAQPVLEAKLCAVTGRGGEGRAEELGDGGLAGEWTSPEEGVDAS